MNGVVDASRLSSWSRTLAAIVLAACGVCVFAPAGHASAQREEPAIYFGAAAGWSLHEAGASTSAATLLHARAATGALVLFCERGRIGFHLTLDATHRRSRDVGEDGILKVYALEADDGAAPLGQFRMRFLSATDMRSAPLHQPEWSHPEHLREIIERHGAGLRLVASLVRQGEFLPAREIQAHLPAGTDGSAISMRAALAGLDRACGGPASLPRNDAIALATTGRP